MFTSDKSSLLLHACCAPCVTHPFQVLSEIFNVTVFFYNPNIHPEEEYRQRLNEMEALASLWGFDLIAGEYDDKIWFERVSGMEEEFEGGKRCALCYRMRLEKTAQTAKAMKIGTFAATLTISPHKKASSINPIGMDLALEYGLSFYEGDFKKRDGFKHSCRISKAHGLYRQDYCGCVYSRR